MEDTCIHCGEVVPEGRWSCWKCEHDIEKRKEVKNNVLIQKEEED